MKSQTVETNEGIMALVDQGKEIAGNLRDQVVTSAKTADKAVRKHPYKAVSIAFGVGAVLGFLLMRRSTR